MAAVSSPETAPKAAPDIAQLTLAADAGDPGAKQQLFSALYAELHRMARYQLWKNDGGVSLSATTLVHEAYLGISRSEGLAFPDKGRFMAYAARAMRGLIIDHVRERRALKRGGGFEFTTLDSDAQHLPQLEGLQSLSDALEELALIDAPLAELVDLKFFCGLSFAEIASLRGISERTVQRDWQKARLLLHRSLS